MKDIKISLFEMILEFAEIFSYVNGKIHSHLYDVGYIVMRILEKMEQFDEDKKIEIIMAALLHDIGALKDSEKERLLKFEVNDFERHERIGFFLLNSHEPFYNIAYIIRYHHVKWNKIKEDISVPAGSYIISLADRFSVLLNENKKYFEVKNEILDTINKESGKSFDPELVSILNELAKEEAFWLDIVYGDKKSLIYNKYKDKIKINCLKDILGFGKIISFVIDFRDRFTAIHTTGVAHILKEIAAILGYSEKEQEYLSLAGFLHDIGKLAVPVEILDKRGALTEQEFEIIKSHAYHSYRIISRIKGFEELAEIAAYHHEKLNGNGYPFHINYEKLSIEARMMAVADVFTALSEKRPYRERMKKEQIIDILDNMVKLKHLDKDIVEVVKENYENLEKLNIYIQKELLEELKLIDEFIYYANGELLEK